MTPAPPAFAAPWHAQLLALTVHLSEQGHFTWPDWTARFGAALADAGGDLDGGDDYFLVWLSALERMLLDGGLAEARTLSDLRRAWEEAFLTTPHGAPVRLAGRTPPRR